MSWVFRFRRDGTPRRVTLGADDLARLGATLRQRGHENPECIAAVRLLFPTVAYSRPGKIRRLRWCEVKPDRLALIDAKTGPRHVLLGEATRELLRGLAEPVCGEWVFPGGKGSGPLSTNDLRMFWTKARDVAGIVADARPHDLRHARASHAVVNGESLHVAGRLLGHRRASTTNRYVHLDDATLSKASDRIAMVLQGKLHPMSCMASKMRTGATAEPTLRMAH